MKFKSITILQYEERIIFIIWFVVFVSTRKVTNNNAIHWKKQVNPN